MRVHIRVFPVDDPAAILYGTCCVGGGGGL